jgi:hypothetical protein
MIKVMKPETDEECRARCELLYPLGENATDKVLNELWRLAWEYGHSSGYGEVANYYCDLSQLAMLGIISGRCSAGQWEL